MSEEKFKDYAKKMINQLSKLGILPADLVIEDHLKQVYAQALEDAAKELEGYYDSYGEYDWKEEEFVTDKIKKFKQKAKEVREGEK